MGIEIHGQVTSFVAGDHFHDRSDEIHLKLDEITKKAREFGYTPETEWVLHNIEEEEEEEEEKEESLGSHSEKLALAFALIISGDDLKVTVYIMHNRRAEMVICHFFNIYNPLKLVVQPSKAHNNHWAEKQILGGDGFNF
ncbi:putative DYW domain-containing protein [Helianthus debilis subsp. tardiflorus]